MDFLDSSVAVIYLRPHCQLFLACTEDGHRSGFLRIWKIITRVPEWKNGSETLPGFSVWR